MSKREFLKKLRKGLSSFTNNEIEEKLLFYSEMIDDQIEEGFSEEEAVLKVGSVEKIVEQLAEETAPIKTPKKSEKPNKKLGSTSIILLILGSPIWISLIATFFAVILSLYALLWAVVISLWAVFISFVAGFAGGLIAGIVFIFSGHIVSSLAMFSCFLVCAGLCIFAFYGSKMITIMVIRLSRKMIIFIKNCFFLLF